MKEFYGSSAHAIAIAGCSFSLRLMGVLRSKGLLTDDEFKNLASAAEADARGLGTVTGNEAASLIAKLGVDMGNA